MKRISIIIPAYNEADRIGKTLEQYSQFFLSYRETAQTDYELVVVLNGCTDATRQVVEKADQTYGNIVCLETERAGKGLAVALGFRDALTRPNDFIGFVDADMSTLPEDFAKMIPFLVNADGVIASRYMKGSDIYPPRPFIKKWGRKLVYHSLVRCMFGLSYTDYQCGAKIFRRNVIETVAPHLKITQWAFDVELLYLCKKHGFSVIEVPTVWRDQADSKLKVLRAGTRMLGSLFEIKKLHKND